MGGYSKNTPQGVWFCGVEEGEEKNKSSGPYIYCQAAKYLFRNGEFLVTVTRD
jgi:hypothetical protein